ncbi:MAG TPA: ribonuclease R [Clostridiales bacterium]|nr:ribonuclease R [Clostridiales bacterium]
MDKTQILNAVNDSGGRLTSFELFERYFKGENYDLFGTLLGELESRGEVVFTKKGRVAPTDRSNIVTGVFQANPRGFGFVRPEGADKSRDSDIFISAYSTSGAINEDLVQVKITRKSGRGSPDNDEGSIVRILEHRLKSVSGTLYELSSRIRGINSNFYVHPDNEKVAFDILIPETEIVTCPPGSKVEVEITGYPDGDGPAWGKIIEIFGEADTFGAAYSAILYDNDIIIEFPADVEEEARRISARPVTAEGRLDLRGKNIFTIDSISARDLDDAISIEREGDGYILGVHIADVAEYVKMHSIIDNEAYARGTSVYFPDRVAPMLPKALSNGCCSLNAGEDKYALSAFIRIGADGTIGETELAESVISTVVRGVYTEMNDLCEKGENSEFYAKYSRLYPDDFPSMIELYRILEEKSKDRGALELESDEAEIILDGDGSVIDIRRADRGITERMIEQFMLAANEGVANWLFWQSMPCVYRVHDEPNPEKINTFSVFAHNLGLDITPLRAKTLHPKSLSTVLNQARENGVAGVASNVLLRALSKARYDAVCSPHFGLAIEKYCHFTSPIRRYPDLSVHRIVKTILHGEADADNVSELEDFAFDSAEASSENELRALNAERAVDALYRCEYMSRHIGETFDGVISSVMRFGFFVELDNTCEGLVPVATLDGYFEYNERTMSLHCGRRRFTLGQRVRVEIESVNMTESKISMRLVEEPK